MSIVDLIGFISIAICFAASGFMVFWCDDDDGIIGKIGLGMISMGCVAILIELTEGVTARFTPIRILIVCGMAIFLVRHLWRTWKFSRRGKE